MLSDCLLNICVYAQKPRLPSILPRDISSWNELQQCWDAYWASVVAMRPWVKWSCFSYLSYTVSQVSGSTMEKQLEEGKNLVIGRNIIKHRLRDLVWLLNSWTTTNCVYPHETLAVNILAQIERSSLGPPLTEEVLTVDNCRGGRIILSFLNVWPLVDSPHCSRWSYTYNIWAA